MTFPYDKEPREPKLQVTYATKELVQFSLTDTDPSIANAIRRVMLAEVPTMAIEIVNVDDNQSVLFDEFIAHRLGLLPLSCHAVGDIPPDLEFGFREHKDCNCFDGCPYCTVEYKLEAKNTEDKVMNVTHFDMVKTDTFSREMPDYHQVRCLPLRDESRTGDDYDEETRENGILICKLKKDQGLRMIAHARKGIPKYHAKFMPIATVTMRYQPIIELDEEMLGSLTLDEKIDFVTCCPKAVYVVDGDKVVVDKLDECMYCDECVSKARYELGKKDMVKIKHNQNLWMFNVEAVTPDGPRSAIDVVRAGLRVLDWKLSLFLKDTWGDEITSWLPHDPPTSYPE